MPGPASREIYAQIEATTVQIGKLHEILLSRIRHGDGNARFAAETVRELVDMELKLRELAMSIFE